MALNRAANLICLHATAIFFDGDLRGGFRRKLDQLTQVVGLRQVQLGVAAARQAFRQQNIAVAHADQAADLYANGFPQATDFTVTPFGQRDVVPLVNPFTTGKLDGFEPVAIIVFLASITSDEPSAFVTLT